MVKKVAESGEKGKEEKGVTHVAGVNATLKPTYQGIEALFERAEHARHKEHAEELLEKLVGRKIRPLMGDGFVDYDEGYDDFSLFVEWWDYNDRGEFVWAGTLQYFLKYYYPDGRYLSDKELSHQINEVRKDLLRREKEREEWAKELEKRLEEGEEND